MAKRKRNKKSEFSKKLLYADYIILIVLLVIGFILGFPTDLATVIVAWIAAVGISQTAYYWKAKSENRTKVPLKVIESLPPKIRKELDLTQVIISIIQSE